MVFTSKWGRILPGIEWCCLNWCQSALLVPNPALFMIKSRKWLAFCWPTVQSYDRCLASVVCCPLVPNLIHNTYAQCTLVKPVFIAHRHSQWMNFTLDHLRTWRESPNQPIDSKFYKLTDIPIWCWSVPRT